MASQSDPAAAASESVRSAEELAKVLDSFDDGSWGGWARKHLGLMLVYAAGNPMSFVYYVLLVLSPLLILAAICAYKLAKEIEQRNKEEKRKQRREANIKKSRSKKDS